MDRRIALGLVGLLLTAWSSGESSAQAPPPARDPSAQPSVGMVPIRSLNDSINDVSTIPNGVPMASNRVPTSPVTSGPAATIPNPPVLNEPVSMTPIDPLHHSISHGFGSGRIASLFRKPGARPTLPASTTPVRYLPSLGATTAPPSSMSRLPALPAPPSNTTFPAPSGGRPSPYAGQMPETARPQADPVVVPASATAPGRPAPYINQVHPAARLQSPTEARPTNPRPQLDPATTPTYRPIESTPVTSPAPRPAEPSPAAEAPGVFPVLPTDLPATPPLGPTSTDASTPAPVPVAAVEPQPAALPVLETTEPVAATAPTVVMVSPPAELPDLAAVTPLAKPVAAAPTTQPAALVADLEAGPSPVDAQVKRTSTDEAALQIKNSRFKKDQKFLTYPAATVGDEIITINELNDAVRLQMSEYPDIRNIAPDSPEFVSLMSQIAGMTLKNLIEERLILQDFKAKVKTHPRRKKSSTNSLTRCGKPTNSPYCIARMPSLMSMN